MLNAEFYPIRLCGLRKDEDTKGLLFSFHLCIEQRSSENTIWKQVIYKLKREVSPATNLLSILNLKLLPPDSMKITNVCFF